MATTTVFRDMNVVGNRVEDLLELTIASGDTEAGPVQSRLRWIESAVVYARQSDSSGDSVVDPLIYVNINSNDEGADDANPGYLYLSQIEDPGEAATFYCRLIGW